MKVGDLVKFSWSQGFQADCVGIVVEEFIHDLPVRAINELRVRWFDEGGKDVRWVRQRDLEIVSESR